MLSNSLLFHKDNYKYFIHSYVHASSECLAYIDIILVLHSIQMNECMWNTVFYHFTIDECRVFSITNNSVVVHIFCSYVFEVLEHLLALTSRYRIIESEAGSCLKNVYIRAHKYQWYLFTNTDFYMSSQDSDRDVAQIKWVKYREALYTARHMVST